MLFNSLQFLIFFPVVTLGYFLLPHRYRWSWLLAASCYFYIAFIPVYIFILFFTIGIDYVAGLAIAGSAERRRKVYLIVSLVANCLVLAVFKYFNFLNGNFGALAQAIGWNYPIPYLQIILPIGLSFHTFQSMSYTIEVYRGRQPVERNLGIFALYVMFYPQLVAGPIERPQNLLHQFREVHSFDYNRVTDGLKLMAWGLFKKVVIADQLAVVVNQVYNKPTEHQGLALVIGTVLFAYQIYCDFSGYSDIAIGAAKVMGFKLMNNFDRPYYAKSISEFWKRWHISLSSWFRDYLYISLGGNRVSVPRWYFNLFFTFLVSGLWHGAKWTFVIWGALHGTYLIMSIVTADFREKFVKTVGLDRLPWLRKCWQVFFVFVLVDFGWIFFRANNLHDAFYIISHMFTGLGDVAANATSLTMLAKAASGIGLRELAPAILAIIFMEFVQLLQRRNNVWELLSNKPGWLRWSFYYAAALYIVFFGSMGAEQFIYFQF